MRRKQALTGMLAVLAVGLLSAQAPADPSLESALKVLDRASGLFAIYAAQAGSRLTIVTELTPQAIQSGRWKNGADLYLSLTNEDGAVVGEAHGRIGGDANSAVLVVPLSGAPVRATIRLHDDRGTAADGVRLAISGRTLVGDPLAYRSSGRTAPRAAADFEFRRNESIRIEWPLLALVETHGVRLLDRHGRAIPVDLPLVESADHTSLTSAMGLAGFAAGDYLIELTAAAHGTSERTLLAIRVK